jgi:hypothetical protein
MSPLKAGFWYLASPYSHQSAWIRDKRALDAERATYNALRQGYVAFSPVHATHGMACMHSLPKDAAWWSEYNRQFLDTCAGILVLTIDGWKTSLGVQAEIKIGHAKALPIRYIDKVGVISESEV